LTISGFFFCCSSAGPRHSTSNPHSRRNTTIGEPASGATGRVLAVGSVLHHKLRPHSSAPRDLRPGAIRVPILVVRRETALTAGLGRALRRVRFVRTLCDRESRMCQVSGSVHSPSCAMTGTFPHPYLRIQCDQLSSAREMGIPRLASSVPTTRGDQKESAANRRPSAPPGRSNRIPNSRGDLKGVHEARKGLPRLSHGSLK
jgi:hypothetical protein